MIRTTVIVAAMVACLSTSAARAQPFEQETTTPTETAAVESSRGPNWGAIISFGIAGIALALVPVAWVNVDSVNDDLQPFRIRVGRDLTEMGVPPDEVAGRDACTEMNTLVESDPSYQEGLSLCSKGSTWSALTHVFLGVSAAAAITGLVFLIAGAGDDDQGSSTARLVPSFGSNGASIDVWLTF